jgi:hypothetical protein
MCMYIVLVYSYDPHALLQCLGTVPIVGILDPRGPSTDQ